MPTGLIVALIFWAIVLGLLYVGIAGSSWNIGKRLARAKTPGEKVWLWIVRIIYIIALPLTIVMVILGAKFMLDDFINLFKG